MKLSERMTISKDTDRPRVQAVAPAPQAQEQGGLFRFTADFFTAHRIVHADLTGAELRLSDCLNSSKETVDIQPSYLTNSDEGDRVDFDRGFGTLNKSGLLFVVPLVEPKRLPSAGNASWKATKRNACWAGIGPYQIAGTIHTEAGRDPRIALRLLDKQFVPLTDVKITLPDRNIREFPTIIVNRTHLEVLAVRTPY